MALEAGPLPRMRETRIEFPAASHLGPASSNHCKHLGSAPVDRSSVYLSFSNKQIHTQTQMVDYRRRSYLSIEHSVDSSSASGSKSSCTGESNYISETHLGGSPTHHQSLAAMWLKGKLHSTYSSFFIRKSLSFCL